MRSPVPVSVHLPFSLLRASPACCVRSFCSTRPAGDVGPQSPDYIEIPKPLQPSFPPRSVVKGYLPVPRDVFRIRSPIPKESATFLGPSTRPPNKLKVPGQYNRDAEHRLYKQRLAEKRRAALLQGVKELHVRKAASDSRFRAMVQQGRATRRELAMAPPREIDVLTQTSVPKGIRDYLGGNLPSSSRSAVTSARRKAYNRRVANVEAKRSSRLHHLYLTARTFIVDEQQLDDAIENAFGNEETPMAWDASGNMGPRDEVRQGLSPWYGPMPEGVTEKLQKLMGGEGVGLAKERLKEVTEEFTGGKL